MLYASASVQELSLDYSRCQSDAPQCSTDNSTYNALPSSAVTSYFKTASSNKVPQWCRTTEDITFPSSIRYTANVCRLQFNIPDAIGPPVLLYYQLTNFYQNHRRYVKSFDQDQLSGQFRDNSSISKSDCDPLRIDPDTNKPYYPCGLIANSLFNDTFNSPLALNWPNATGLYEYKMSNSGIAWSTDANLYGKSPYTPDQVSPPPNWRIQYPVYNSSIPFKDLTTDEAFQVWMRTAGLPTFSKLALRNDDTAMEAGTYQMDIYDCKWCLVEIFCPEQLVLFESYS